jgi:hypothetical protein
MAIDSEAHPDGVVITNAEMKAHMARVESVFSLVEKMLTALAGNPMFAAMLPPDLQQELRNV